MTVDKVLLDVFLATVRSDPTRVYLHAPMVIGEWVYRTDGRRCVRVPRDGEEETEELRCRPDEVLPWTHGEVGEWLGVMGFQQVEMKSPGECGKCLGEGTVECGECGSIVDCKECDGSGRVGPMPVPRQVWLTRDARLVAEGSFWAGVCALPGAEVAAVDVWKGAQMVRFRCAGGGEGMFMMCRPGDL